MDPPAAALPGDSCCTCLLLAPSCDHRTCAAGEGEEVTATVVATAAGAAANVLGGDGNPNPSVAPPSTTPGSTRRRRFPEPARVVATAAGPSWERRVRASSSVGSLESEHHRPVGQPLKLAIPLAQPPPAAARVWPVAFGSLSMVGQRRPRMEDAVSLRPEFFTWADGSPMHFFGVFDGHGGTHVAMLCRDRMHEVLAEELMRQAASFLVRREHAMAGVGTSAAAGTWVEQAEEERAWRDALAETFRRIDAMAALQCACGRVVRDREPPCRCPLSPLTGYVGSTAVVAVLVRDRLVVANCGDSRAVLCRRGPPSAAPVPLSSDHKPNRPDEFARILAKGGKLMFTDALRVRGVLAISRALGDRMLEPEVICEPEITITERTAEDECLILASDGMWDMVENEAACYIARRCLEDGNPPPPNHPVAAVVYKSHGLAEPRCSRAAIVLAKLAITRKTNDDISIIVIDLKARE